jgi:hypothetical protein
MINARDARTIDGIGQDVHGGAPAVTPAEPRKAYLPPQVQRIEVGTGTQNLVGSYNDLALNPDPGIS